MKEIINLEKLSSHGYKMPANNPNIVSPDNITHAQLRYNTFTSSYVIQGTVVSGSNSTFEFDVNTSDLHSSGKTHSRMKLYGSTDGTNYTEIKSYGGTYGKSLLEEGIMVCSVGFQNPIGPTLNVLYNTVYNNNIHVTFSQLRDSEGLYRIALSEAIITAGQENVITDRVSIVQDLGGVLGYCVNDPGSATTDDIYFTTSLLNLNAADDVAVGHLIQIKFIL